VIDVINEPDNSPAGGTAPDLEPVPSRRPWVTWLSVLLCVAVFLGLAMESDRDSWATMSKWGYRPAGEIWAGQYLALVSCAFVHFELWHLAFNLYWLWLLGKQMELAIGSAWYSLFFLVAAVISSTAELAVSDSTGIGASGVVYAIFGFMWIGRRRFPAFKTVLSLQTIKLFVIWLVGCVVATILNIWNVGNAAHFAGLVFGASAASCLVVGYRPRFMFVGLTGLVALCLLPLFWCPWSGTWLGLRAYDAHKAGNYRLAIDYYDQVIRKDPKSAWAYANRGSAYESLNDVDRADADLKKAEELDSSYSFRDSQ
jgi:GlpG protein